MLLMGGAVLNHKSHPVLICIMVGIFGVVLHVCIDIFFRILVVLGSSAVVPFELIDRIQIIYHRSVFGPRGRIVERILISVFHGKITRLGHLCGDKDDAGRGAAAINGRRGRVLENGYVLHIGRNHVVKGTGNTVDDHQRVVVGSIGVSPDTDGSLGIGSTVGAGYLYTGYLTLKSIGDHRLGAFGDVIAADN